MKDVGHRATNPMNSGTALPLRLARLEIPQVQKMEVCTPEILSTVQSPLSSTVDSIAAGTSTRERVQVAPGNRSADTPRPHGRRKDGSKSAIDRYRGLEANRTPLIAIIVGMTVLIALSLIHIL